MCKISVVLVLRGPVVAGSACRAEGVFSRSTWFGRHKFGGDQMSWTFVRQRVSGRRLIPPDISAHRVLSSRWSFEEPTGVAGACPGGQGHTCPCPKEASSKLRWVAAGLPACLPVQCRLGLRPE